MLLSIIHALAGSGRRSGSNGNLCSSPRRTGGNMDEQTGGAAEASAAIAEAESHNEPKTGTKDKLEELCVNTIRFLAIDGVEKAKSGHPGAPMGMADMAFVLWTDFMRHDPKAK